MEKPVIKIPMKRTVVGEATLNGVLVRVLGLTFGEKNDIIQGKNDSPKAAMAFMAKLLPNVLEGPNGEAVDVDINDVPDEEVIRIWDILIKGKSKTDFTNTLPSVPQSETSLESQPMTQTDSPPSLSNP